MNLKLLPAYVNMTVLIESLTWSYQEVQVILKYILVRFKQVSYSNMKRNVIC